MTKSIQAIKGMKDILPTQTPLWQHVERTIQHILHSYSYRELRTPIMEKTELFRRSIGEVTDIVEKEMYTFMDRNGDSLTLRPENTAACIRAGLEHSLFQGQGQRLWYIGPMFRHERPQKGRYRQFHQIGVEAYGIETPDIEAEMVLMAERFWKTLGLPPLALHINSLGSPQARATFRQTLVDYFSDHPDQLDEDSQRRLNSNPLRILDSKNKDMQPLIEAAPRLIDCLDTESAEHFDQFRAILDAGGITYTVNSRLVRGLDYYNRTVFEWMTDALGAQGTVCGGGRYDGLVELSGGKPTPGVGFAMGLERLIALIELAQTVIPDDTPHVYLIMVSQTAVRHGLVLSEILHDALPNLRMHNHCGGGSFKSQFKKADKSGAVIALVLGEDECQHEEITVKYLRENKPQITVSTAHPEHLIAVLAAVIDNK